MAQWKGTKRFHKVNEMLTLESIFRLGETANVLRLWRCWHDASQAELAKELGVNQTAISVLERWGTGGFAPEYQDRLQKALEGFDRMGIKPEMLGLQYEGLPTRFAKKVSE